MSTKRYRLEKDLPDAKAGTILVSDGASYRYESIVNGVPKGTLCYYSDYVENNPEWFSLIEDESVFDEKKINERLNQLVEMEEAFNAARLTHPLAGFKYDTFRDYAKEKHNETFPSHQSIKEEQPLRHFNEVENERMKEWAERYSKESKIKRQNPTEERLRWRDRKKRDWEIVACERQDGTIFNYYKNSNTFAPNISQIEILYNDMMDYINRGVAFKIHSVKRLSDNEVFTVGDTIHHAQTNKQSPVVIKSFYINDKGEMACLCDGKNSHSNYYIENWVKITAQPQPTKERTEVTFLSEFAGYFGGAHHHVFWSTKEIPKDKYELVKSAIEAVLNGGGVVINPGENVYTKAQVDEIEEAAWDAARDVEKFLTDVKYQTHQDYKKSKA